MLVDNSLAAPVATRMAFSSRTSQTLSWTRALVVMACVAVAASASIGWARTIVLVYDDSGSMNEQSRAEFASYATQNLLALLSPDDRLEVVRMSAPDRWTVLLPERSQQEGIATIAQWPVGASTPYLTVQTAAARLRALGQSNTDPDEDFWFVFFSDGAFQEGGGDVPLEVIRQRLALDLAELRDDFEGRRLGVLFLGIGPDADRHADVWETSGAIVDTAVTSREIIDALFRIAALVTGRDPQADAGASTLVARPGAVQGTLDVTTALPLQRLVVFYQGTRASSLRVLDGRSSIQDGPSATVAPVRSSEPLRTAGGGVFGSVTGVVGARFGEVMGPGTFTLVLEGDAPVDLADLRFLPEVALGLEVVQTSRQTDSCAGRTVTLEAGLVEVGTGKQVDLADLTGLDITAELDAEGDRRTIAFRPIDATTYRAEVAVPLGRSTVSVTARFPGYFNLRSRILAFDGIECATDARFSLAPARIESPVRMAAGEDRVGDLALAFEGVGRPRQVTLMATGLPQGWSIELAGRRLTATNPRLSGVSVPADGRLDASVWRGDPALPGTVEVVLSVVSEDSSLRFGLDRATLAVSTTPVTLRLEPNDLGAIEVPPTEAAVLTEFQQLTLALRPVDSAVALRGSEALLVSATGLPDGVALAVDGVILEGADASAEVPLSPTVQVSLLRDRRYRAAAVADVVIEFASPDPRVVVRDGRATLRFPVVARSGEMVAVSDTVLTLTRTVSPTPVAVAGLKLEVRTDPVEGRAPEPETVHLSVAGLPDGVELEVLGSFLRDEDDRVDIAYQGSHALDVVVLRSSAYVERDDRVVRLTVSSDDPRRTWRSQVVDVTLRPAPRELDLVPRSDPWTASQDGLSATPGYRLEAIVDGTTASADDLATWDVGIEVAPARLRPVLEVDAESGVVLLHPRPVCVLGFWCIPGLTPVGEQIVIVRATAGDGETAQGRAVLTIVRASIWRAWLWPLTQLLVALGVLVVAIGYATKTRFPRGSTLCFRKEPRPKTFLPGPKQHVEIEPLRFARHRISWTRWLPFVPERASFDVGFGFTAGRSGQVVLTRIATDEKVLWTASKIERGDLPLSLGEGDVLSVERPTEAEVYTFTLTPSCGD